MAITDNIYQDLIMNPEGVPNALQNLQRFSPLTNQADIFTNQRFDEIPGFNFIDAPIETPFIQRAFKPEFRSFLNNPAVLNPVEKIGSGITSITNKAKSGFGKGIDLGKAAIGGIASLATGIPGIGLLLNALQPMSPEEEAMRDFYGDQFGLTDTGQIASGIMQGYNPVSLTGFGLSDAIDKRIARINKTLDKQRKDKKRKESDVLKQRLQALEALKAKEAAAAAKQLESQRRGRRPTAPSGDGGGVKDSGGPTGGYSYDAGGRQGFGFGLKDGGLAGLL